MFFFWWDMLSKHTFLLHRRPLTQKHINTLLKVILGLYHGVPASQHVFLYDYIKNTRFYFNNPLFMLIKFMNYY